MVGYLARTDIMGLVINHYEMTADVLFSRDPFLGSLSISYRMIHISEQSSRASF
jgi:hypothetical protein